MLSGGAKRVSSRRMGGSVLGRSVLARWCSRFTPYRRKKGKIFMSETPPKYCPEAVTRQTASRTTRVKSCIVCIEVLTIVSIVLKGIVVVSIEIYHYPSLSAERTE